MATRDRGRPRQPCGTHKTGGFLRFEVGRAESLVGSFVLLLVVRGVCRIGPRPFAGVLSVKGRREDGAALKALFIDGVSLGDDAPCYVIAEIGHNHQGSLEQAKELFKAAKECGASAV